MSVLTDIARELSRDAAARHARWDANTWQELVDGPAAALEKSLGLGGDAVVRAYLELCAEGVALGYLFPESSQASGFLNVLFRVFVPERLAKVPAPLRLPTLAGLWNLGENLEAQPFFISAIFMRKLQRLEALSNLEALVEDVTAALERNPMPGAPLRRAFWMDASESDRRFLPGGMHFLTPTVVCIHDRFRTAAGGRQAVTTGVWLSETPLGLGPTRCTEGPALTHTPSLEISELQRQDPMVDELFTTTRSDAGLVISLRTSQRIVAVLP